MFAHSRVQPRACSGLCLAPSVTMNPASFVSILAHKREAAMGHPRWRFWGAGWG